MSDYGMILALILIPSAISGLASGCLATIAKWQSGRRRAAKLGIKVALGMFFYGIVVLGLMVSLIGIPLLFLGGD
jgi:hypothetical protein